MGAGERAAGDKNINLFSFSGVAGEESINSKKFLGAIGLTKDESAATPSLPVFEDLKKHKKEIQSYATLLVVQCNLKIDGVIYPPFQSSYRHVRTEKVGTGFKRMHILLFSAYKKDVEAQPNVLMICLAFFSVPVVLFRGRFHLQNLRGA